MVMAFVMGRDDRILEIYKHIAKSQFQSQNPGFVLAREPFYAGSTETGDEVITFYSLGGKNQLIPLDEAYYQLLRHEFSGRISMEPKRYVYDSAWAAGFAANLT